MLSTKTPILTVGDIKSAIEGKPDSTPVISQIVAADGSFWCMACVITPVFNNPDQLVIDLRHPQLKTLPDS